MILDPFAPAPVEPEARTPKRLPVNKTGDSLQDAFALACQRGKLSIALLDFNGIASGDEAEAILLTLQGEYGGKIKTGPTGNTTWKPAIK